MVYFQVNVSEVYREINVEEYLKCEKVKVKLNAQFPGYLLSTKKVGLVVHFA